MESTNLPVKFSPEIRMLSGDEIESLSVDERRSEEFMLYSMGWTQAKLAKHFGIAQSTIQNDLKIEMQKRRARAANIDDEIERITGVVESVMVKAWTRHEEAFDANPNSVAATNYLKLVLEAADRVAVLRGFDAVKASSKTVSGATRVVVQIGGSRESPQIAVGVEA